MDQMQLIWFKCKWQRNSLLFNAYALLLVCIMRLLSKLLAGFIWRLQEEAFSTQRGSFFYLHLEPPTPRWAKPTHPHIPLYSSKIWSPPNALSWLLALDSAPQEHQPLKCPMQLDGILLQSNHEPRNMHHLAKKILYSGGRFCILEPMVFGER